MYRVRATVSVHSFFALFDTLELNYALYVRTTRSQRRWIAYLYHQISAHIITKNLAIAMQCSSIVYAFGQ